MINRCYSVMDFKKCKDCKETKHVSHFHKTSNNAGSASFYNVRCKACRQARRKASGEYARGGLRVSQRYRSDPEFRATRQEATFRSNHGISYAERDARLAAQGGLCAICGTDQPTGKGWCVDHDDTHHHEKKSQRSCPECQRAILCAECNFGIGKFSERPDLLRRAAEYVEEWHSLRTWDVPAPAF